MKMGKRKTFAEKSSRLLLLLEIFCVVIAPIHSEPYGSGGKSLFVGKKFDDVVASSHEEPEEELCRRLPPKYSNSSGSLQYSNFDLLSLLKHGTDLMDETKYVDRATLILGNTGSGKTTISQILSGNLDSLHAVLTQSDRLVIIDDQFKISGPSTTSKTLIPELVVMQEDPAKNEVSTNATVIDDDYDGPTIFYDCPGFDDTRGPDQDLAANFFMNHVVRRKVNQVKMLFLVIHSSVKLGNDRLDFDLLTSHAIKFVKNLPKYGHSIGLVVTKVSSYNARGRYIPDKTILKEIVEFLHVYREAMLQKLGSVKMSPEESKFVENKIKFVDILLEQDKNGEYTRITFSRDPDRCGPLSESKVVVQNRKRILALCENQLEYRPANYSDFGYTLKDSTALTIRRVFQNINKEMAAGIQNVIASFENWVKRVKLERRGSNVTEVLKFAEATHEKLSKLVDDLQNITNSSTSTSSSLPSTARSNVNVVEIAGIFTRALRKIGYHVTSKFEHFMERQQAYIEFFEADDSSKILETWIESSAKLRDNYADMQTWCKFYLDLEEKLSMYSFQKRRNDMANSSKLNNASEWLSFLEVEGKLPVPVEVKDFGRQIDGNKNWQYFGTKLNEVMQFAMKPVTVKCNGTAVQVSGNFVLLSDFAALVKEKVLCLDGGIKRVETYASHTIFIDRDIEAEGRELNVVIVAPQWTIIGQRQFNLQGSSPPPVSLTRAKSGRDFYGEDGTNGVPGKPGGPGGSMFGVADNVNTDPSEGGNLMVNCDGGNGGTGQDGGDGGRGLDGRDTAHGSNYRTSTDVNFLWVIYKKDRVEYEGYSGTNGGNAGKGGIGGSPGMPGKFSLDILGEKSAESAGLVQASRRAGEVGQPGDSGFGGNGGRPGDSMNCYKHAVFHYFTWGSCERQGARGTKGADGYTWGWNDHNYAGYEPPKPPTYSIVKWQSLLEFKQIFYDLHSSENSKVKLTDSFMELVDKNPYIMGDTAYQIQFFVEEFTFLEQSTSSTPAPSSAPLYSNFIIKFEGFAENARHYMHSSHRQTVNLLLAAAYSKLVSLKQGSSRLGYAIDIQTYLKYVKHELEGYSAGNLTNALEELQSKFETDLQEKAENVVNFAQNIVAPFFVKATADQGQRLIALERRFTQLVNNSAEVNWENSKWQLQRGNDIQETLELSQVLGVAPLMISLINFLAGRDTLSFLTSPQVNNASWYSRKAEDLFEKISTLSQNLPVPPPGNNTVREVSAVYFGPLITSSLYDKFSQDPDQNAKLEELLEQAEILTTDAYEKRVIVQQSVAPLVESIMNYFENRVTVNDNLKDTTKQIHVKEHVQIIKKNLGTLVDDVKNRMYLNVIDGIQESFTLILNLYDNMEQYENIRKLVSYMISASNDQLRTFSRNRYSNNETNFPLERILELHVLEREYQSALLAVRQWAFPFAKLYRENISPNYFNTFAEAQAFYVKQLETLEEERNRTLSMMSSSSGVFHREDFYAEPFFVWENSKWSGEIRDLLAGKKVHLKADIKQAVGYRDAVKFHLVHLNFKLKDRNDEEEEMELKRQLGNFRVSMTHSGVSYYKFKNDYYVMTGMNQTIQYNFENMEELEGEEDGEEVVGRESPNHSETNDVYEKFKSGEYHTSPYTLWTIQLEKIENGNDTGNGTLSDPFNDLQNWAKWVDVELVGKGVWVDGQGPDDLEVDKYYEKDDSLSADDFEFAEKSTKIEKDAEEDATTTTTTSATPTENDNENEIQGEFYDIESIQEGSPPPT